MWSYEIGEKGRFFDQRLTVNADVYYLHWSGVQVPITLPCGYPYVDNAATAGVKGSELEIHARLTEALSLNQTVGYTFATYLRDVTGCRHRGRRTAARCADVDDQHHLKV